jgi:hypothetical protein
MFWSHPKPWAKSIGRVPRPEMRTLLRSAAVILIATL